MSQKPKKTKSAAMKEPKPASPAANKPTGHSPTANVVSRHGEGLVTRAAKGFSKGEVSSSGIPLRLARKWGLPLDYRRRSILEANVTSVKDWAGHAGTVRKPEGEIRKIEEEVIKVEKVVKKEAAKLKKEVKKVEEEVVEKVEQPMKSRARKKSPPVKKAS
ncbi:MAG: ribosomal protein L13e [Thaumarchaeota archaeon]|nr:ribosomal protein L13e [Nitrososphaerota archaeon]